MSSRTERLKGLLTRNEYLYEKSRMPYAAGRFYLRKPHDPDYRVFGLFPDKKGTFLDVGANAGQSAFSFRIFRRENPILSIEPNPFHRKDLAFTGRVVRRHDFKMVGASDSNEKLELFVPFFRGVPLTPEASLDEESVKASKSLARRIGGPSNLDKVEVESTIVDLMPLDELDASPDFVELDVQGHEFNALKGLTSTLERSAPMLLVETPDSDCRDLLSTLGYRPFSYDPGMHRLTAETIARKNVVFLKNGDRELVESTLTSS